MVGHSSQKKNLYFNFIDSSEMRLKRKNSTKNIVSNVYGYFYKTHNTLHYLIPREMS